MTLVILGEAPGEQEEREGVPFVGASGKLLREFMFPQSGLDTAEWHMLNTFLKRPPNNDLSLFTATKTELKKEGLEARGAPLKKRYVRPEHYWQLVELDTRLKELKPDLILCMGGTALWALTGEAAIMNYRGNFFFSERYNCPAIATYHPAALLYQWSNMPYAWADLTKLKGWLDGDLPAPLHRRFCINPTFAEIANVFATFNRNPDWLLGVDIETSPKTGQITTISFCTPTLGICIPIWDKDGTPASTNFWPTALDELKAWKWIKRFAELPNPKVMQNGLYDMQYLLDAAPIEIRVLRTKDDTAILQHSLQPEMQKALGTLASLYLNEPSWKFMRTQDKDVNKADD